MSRRVDPDTLAAFRANARDMAAVEEDEACAAFAEERVVYYCHGRGHPVLALKTFAEWEQRHRLHRTHSN